jgi:hypothetical protein
MGGVAVKIKISFPLPKDKEIDAVSRLIEALKSNGFDIYNSELVTALPLLTEPRGYAIGKDTIAMMGIEVKNEIINMRYNWDRPPENVQFIPHYRMVLTIYTYLEDVQDVLRTITYIATAITGEKVYIDEIKIGDSTIEKLNLN